MNPIKTLKKEWPALLLLLMPFLIIPFVWDKLPDEIPTHWNWQGEPDDYSSNAFGLFLLPCISILTYALLFLLPRIDPKRNIDSKQKPLSALRFFLPLFFNAIFLVVIFQGLGYTFDINRAVHLLVILLFLVLGNYMSSMRPNYFVGIRTPWTLEDPEVWRRTHRLAAKLWVGGALVLMMCWGVLGAEAFKYVFFGSIMVLALVPVVYSYFIFSSSEGAEGAADDVGSAG
jgi:uncharacterized membrane protein